MAKYQSVQVIYTKHSAAGVEACPIEDATHCSVYLRATDGTCAIEEDYPNDSVLSRTFALSKAAKLSMLHRVPVEYNEDFL